MSATFGTDFTMYDPLKLSEITAKTVCDNSRRKYYRFRPARFYGGISTADCVGCCLRCVFCWSWNIVAGPEEHGNPYTPEEVARRLVNIAKKNRLNQMRISGNEPTICREHLLKVLSLIPGNDRFILETNGILIGNDRSYAEELSAFPNLYVRISLKGTCEEEFSMLTGAVSEGFRLQLRALELLKECGVRVHPASMISFSPRENIRAFRKRLRAIDPAFEDFEAEELILYTAVEERMKKLKLRYFTAHRPDRIPKEQI